ncbi:cytochrome c oxidase subunit 3 [Haoranjiania flava]|uniref:Cytochrome c oxidase subunit 3 n=1 Tax=Haoranjiania flava TaxID=1856322 RepID=A0AAE3IKR0_9BACT|nr:cytochrome c oxidase subunit 3 [Haoranjiania flava]MCU7693038.1 cytochrome c oxidase subunit 3 [Haoranjiania flava]
MSTALTKINTWMGGRSPFNVEYGKLMMWLFLLSDAFTFGGLLITYGATRYATTAWPDPNHVFNSFPGLNGQYPLLFVSLMTFILILSSVTMVLAVQAGHRNDKKEVVKYLILTIVGGLIFIGCQAWEWAHLHHVNAWWGSNPFPNHDGTLSSPNFTNFFFTITGFHGFHVSTGILINIIMLIMTLKNVFHKRGTYQMIEKAGLYWHFVDLVWVFVFTFFYLV